MVGIVSVCLTGCGRKKKTKEVKTNSEQMDVTPPNTTGEKQDEKDILKPPEGKDSSLGFTTSGDTQTESSEEEKGKPKSSKNLNNGNNVKKSVTKSKSNNIAKQGDNIVKQGENKPAQKQANAVGYKKLEENKGNTGEKAKFKEEDIAKLKGFIETMDKMKAKEQKQAQEAKSEEKQKSEQAKAEEKQKSEQAKAEEKQKLENAQQQKQAEPQKQAN